MSSQAHSKTCGKIIVVGDGGCGKTCMLEVFRNNKFPDSYVSTVIDNYIKDIVVNESVVSITIWDTAGQEEYDGVRPLAYQDTDLVFLCFTIEKKDSLENIASKWVPEVRNYSPKSVCFLVGMKADIREENNEKNLDTSQMVTYSDGIRFKEKIGALAYVETSAKRNKNINELFEEAGKYLLECRSPKRNSNKRWFFCYCC
ncbi:small GTP-binding protein domain [Edhazardia aedis USNM 41457]|uniref:Small GTP-binding protein domain n=1 Tax=Edhazardia aedis (strain USNM 41457) TaxID=1003232 RepID=J9D8H6_EDHAE|nr:small GTP-binding protein domain [Edhazardia aedis USNM 41457]|eukprot:EJW04046.1 small GTP-binding protein domain [Edhazardia aedis USNM 41457]